MHITYTFIYIYTILVVYKSYTRKTNIPVDKVIYYLLPRLWRPMGPLLPSIRRKPLWNIIDVIIYNIYYIGYICYRKCGISYPGNIRDDDFQNQN